jgi:hypothetical protein
MVWLRSRFAGTLRPAKRTPSRKTLGAMLKATKYFLIVAILTSCDPGAVEYYSIDNETDKILIIEFSEEKTDSVKTVILLPPKREQILFRDMFLGTIESWSKKDSIQLDCYLQLKNDTSILKINLKDKKYWNHFEVSNAEAWYTLVVK